MARRKLLLSQKPLARMEDLAEGRPWQVYRLKQPGKESTKMAMAMCLSCNRIFHRRICMLVASKRRRVYCSRKCSNPHKALRGPNNPRFVPGAGEASRARSMTKNIHKFRCRYRTRYYIKTGKLIPRPCEVCKSKLVEAHHDDYSNPMSVRWLCSKHHQDHHRNLLGENKA